MRKRFTFAFIGAIAAISISLGYGKYSSIKEVSQITLDNIEALSNPEDYRNLYFWPCYHSGGAQCIHRQSYEKCSRYYEC